MRKYKKEIVTAGCIIALNVVISIWSNDYDISFYVNILRQLQYQLLFSAFLFFPLYDNYDRSLLYVRYVDHSAYIKQAMIKALKEYGVLMLSVTGGQLILFLIMDPLLNAVTLVYRNVIFYILILFVKYILLTLKHSNHLKWIICMYIIWFILLRSAFVFADHPLNTWNVFSLLQRIDAIRIIRHLMILSLCICLNQLRMNDHKRYLKKWLE